jgi:riboflavin transporter FmnP
MKIAKRAQEEVFTPAGVSISTGTIMMDLELVHANFTLDLPSFSEAQGYDFFHDIAGIYRHMNRRSGELEGCFLPRFAKQVNAETF